MRKKSHISLAGQIMESLELDGVFDYKLPFYFGSIWPDCRPSFVTTPHKFDNTYATIEQKLSDLVDNHDTDKGMNVRTCTRLGIIVHYIADYFTFPHNNHYDGNVKDHCYYERDLKHELKAFLTTEEASKVKATAESFDTVDKLSSYICDIHDNYMKVMHNVQEDIRYIVHVCTTVVKSILNMLISAFQPALSKVQYV